MAKKSASKVVAPIAATDEALLSTLNKAATELVAQGASYATQVANALQNDRETLTKHAQWTYDQYPSNAKAPERRMLENLRTAVRRASGGKFTVHVNEGKCTIGDANPRVSGKSKGVTMDTFAEWVKSLDHNDLMAVRNIVATETERRKKAPGLKVA